MFRPFLETLVLQAVALNFASLSALWVATMLQDGPVQLCRMCFHVLACVSYYDDFWSSAVSQSLFGLKGASC